MKDSKINVALAAINERLIDRLPENATYTGNTNGYAFWGKDNRYPNFLYKCYRECPTLQSIINGYVDYIIGNGIRESILEKPNPYEGWDEFITHLASDYVIFGVCYIQVIRNKNNEIKELYWLDSRFVRMDEDNEAYYYNEDFSKNYVRAKKTLVYPKYVAGSDIPSSVYCIKTPFSREVYGLPIWEAAIKDVMVDMGITDFHLSELDNNFSPSAIISFNNGIPTDEEKDEIERLITKKFTGTRNTARFLLSFNNGKENETTVKTLATNDFDKRYDALASKTKDNIYAALRANPQLFGNSVQSGLNDQDYMESFRIFNRTVIYPIQKRIIDGIDKIFKTTGSIKIKPFAIDFEDADTNNNTQIVS